MKKQLLSILLVLVMVIGIIPVNAIAQDIGSSTPQTENYGEFIDGEQVISDMIEKNGLYAHPRIIMSEEKFEKLKTSIGDDSVTGILLDKLRSEADRLINQPVSEYEIPDGIRLLETSKRIQRRVAALAMAYNIFGEEKYARRCYAELEAACDFDDWNPKHFLDTAEMSTAFALGYDWLYHWMDNEQRALLRNNMIEKGLKQVMEDYEDKPRTRTYHWYQDYPGDNWKLVCNGGMSLSALAIGDEDDASDIASEVLTYAYKEAYSFVRRAYSDKDGTYSEGLGYWDYATYYLGLYSSSLTSATGTDYGLADFEGLRKSVDFIRYMSSNTSKSFSFGDDGDSRDTGWAVLLWLGEYFQTYDIATTRLKKIENDSFNYLDVLWIDEEKCPTSTEDSPTDWGEIGASNASFRNTWDESGIVAALHAGINNYKYHGHYDLGSFYIESNGARFFTDLGNEQYELPNRQYSYRIRAEGHNTLAINPSEELDQKEGAECLISSFGGGNEAYAVIDLTAAYEPSGAESVVRGLKMIKDKECVVIQDEISLNAPGEIYWFAHTKGQIEVANNGKSAVVTVDSEKMWVELISSDGIFTVMNAEPLPSSPVVRDVTDNSAYKKLAIHLTNTKDTTICVACIPLKQGEAQPSWLPSMKAISEWSSQAPENTADVVEIPEADDTKFIYNGTTQTYSLAESEHYTISGNKQTNAGTYTVTVALNDKENTVWSDGTTDDKTYTFTIAKATPDTPINDIVMDFYLDATGEKTATASGLPVGMGTETHTIDITDDNGIIAANSVVYGQGRVRFTLNGFDTGKIGISATIKVTLSSQNYNDFSFNVIVKLVAKNVQTITADDVILTYGDTDGKITATTDGDGAISYSTTSDVISVAADGTITVLKAGTATVTVKAAETDTYAAATKTISVTVNKAAATITAKSYTIKVGEALPTYAYNATGLVNGDTLPINVTISCTADGKTAGTYNIVVSGAAASTNYTFSYVNGTLTVSEKEIVAAPVFTPASGKKFTSTQNVTIVCATEGAKIYYTTDGTAPTTASPLYKGTITINKTTTIKAIAVKYGMADSSVVAATYTKKSSGSGGGGGGGTGGGGGGGGSSDSTDPEINGKSASWAAIATEITKLHIGSETIIELNGNYNVPVDVIKAIADRDIKVTFVVDSTNSWIIDGAKIETPVAADLSIFTIASLKADTLRGEVGTKFHVYSTNILTEPKLTFAKKNAGKFANLYKKDGDKLVFIDNVKIGADGIAVLDAAIAGDYVVMLCEFSDRKGDVTNDGVTNALDAAAVLKDVVALENAANPEMRDYNSDGKANALDASSILIDIVNGNIA